MRARTPAKVMRRLLLGAAAALFAVMALTQVAFSTPLALWVINTAFLGEVSIGYDSARSFWPGHVQVRGLRIRGEDSNVQWLLRADESEATISVGELLHRTFHATRSRSRGVSFVARLKMPRANFGEPMSHMLMTLSNFPPPHSRCTRRYIIQTTLHAGQNTIKTWASRYL